MSVEKYTPFYIKPRFDYQYYKESGLGSTGWLLNKIRDACRWESFTGIIIVGKEGSGKSMVALKLARAVYGSWKAVLGVEAVLPPRLPEYPRGVLFFRWQDLEGSLDHVNRMGMVYPTVVWDDMGVYANRYLWRSDPRAADELTTLIQLIREHTRSLIGTTPNPGDVAKMVRERDGWILCALRRIGLRKSHMSCTQYVLNQRKGKIMPGDTAEGVVDIFVPDEVYIIYKALRRKYYAQAKEDVRRRWKERGH